MHPSGLREEDTALRGHGCVVLQQMLQTRDAALAGVRSLNRLRQLHLIAHQHDVASGHAHGDDVGEANLSCLVHEEIVERLIVLRPREQPGGARHELMPARDGVVLEGLLRSEEHTSELQSLMRISYAVFCLKKK